MPDNWSPGFRLSVQKRCLDNLPHRIHWLLSYVLLTHLLSKGLQEAILRATIAARD